MEEWGLFNDEGMVEGGFWSMEEAVRNNVERYTEEDELTAREVCGTCRGGAAHDWHDDCPEWAGEDDDDSEEEA